MKYQFTSLLALVPWAVAVHALEPTPAPIYKRQAGLGGFLDGDDSQLTDPAAISSFSVSFDRQVSSAIAAYPGQADQIRSAQSDVDSYLGVVSSYAASGQAYPTGDLNNGNSGSFGSNAGGSGSANGGGAVGSASMPRATPTGSTSGSALGSAGNSGNGASGGSGSGSSSSNGGGSASGSNSGQSSNGPGSASNSGQSSNGNSGSSSGSSGSNSGGTKNGSKNAASQNAFGGSPTSFVSLAAVSFGLMLGAQLI
ncbi:related to Per-hexamer repeat protein 5 [Sporisorium scitamineum]|uniref:Related to Per-hexamer repeat protein 5 n=2 Tax=Sporisorium scitamineum TaxID=49012 RepID=A0A127ZE97_9BASI|nr:related to Per-hexamer repeat protein 5 [Sporisorium scitamineum]